MDIVRFALALVAERLAGQLLPEQIADIITPAYRETQRYGGGRRHYLPKVSDEEIVDTLHRNQRIRAAWKNGEPQALIGERHGISQAMVSKIVRGKA